MGVFQKDSSDCPKHMLDFKDLKRFSKVVRYALHCTPNYYETDSERFPWFYILSTTGKWGPYKRTLTAALRQAKFYLPRKLNFTYHGKLWHPSCLSIAAPQQKSRSNFFSHVQGYTNQHEVCIYGQLKYFDFIIIYKSQQVTLPLLYKKLTEIQGLEGAQKRCPPQEDQH